MTKTPKPKNNFAPLTEVADSSLVSLTRESEGILAKLQALTDEETKVQEELDSLRENIQLRMEMQQQLIRSHRRTRRLLHAQLQNVQELLSEGVKVPNIYPESMNICSKASH